MKNKIIILVFIVIILSSMVFFTFFVNTYKNYYEKEKTEDLKTNMTDDLNTNEEVVKHEKESLNDASCNCNENLKLATEEDKAKYSITDINYNKTDRVTTIKGYIKNNGGKENIVLKVEFYDSDKLAKSSSSISLNIKNGEKKEFNITQINSVASEDFDVLVEYVGE